MTPFSIYSPHTGVQDNSYDSLIPIAAITTEDADMMQRMQDRGWNITLNLTLENRIVPNANSNNFIAEILGAEFPEKIVLFGGHVDSWDTGAQTGANDDGGGIITCFEALNVINQLIKQGKLPKPRRTLRVIGWSGEEFGHPNNGAQQYFKKVVSDNQLDNHILVFESDLGSTQP